MSPGHGSQGAFVDLGRGPNARLDRALDPGVRERRVLTREVDAALGRADRLVGVATVIGVVRAAGLVDPVRVRRPATIRES